jgi:uncharacterized membrane protein YhaH (DUF805 family)
MRDFVGAVRAGFSKYADFTGRASRPEFWYFVLFGVLTQLVMRILLSGDRRTTNIGALVAALPLILPYLAVGARRLHDTGRSGWWQLIKVVPLMGSIALIVLFSIRGDAGSNRFGPM